MTLPRIDGVGLNLTGMVPGGLDDLPGILRHYRAIGCTHVELTARRLDFIVHGRLDVGRAEAVGAMVAEAGLIPVLHANHAINLMHPTEADLHEAAAAASIAACARFGAASMVLHPGELPRALHDAEAEPRRAAERDRLRRLGDLAGKVGVRLAMENLIGGPDTPHVAYSADPVALAAQLEAVAHDWVGACLDFGHGWLSAHAMGYDYVAALETLSPFVWHLHLHDNFGRRSSLGDPGDDVALGLGDMHAPMFAGSIPWAELLPRMRFRPRTFGGIELNARYQSEAATVVATAHAIAAHVNHGTALPDPYRSAFQ
ncbi:MAG: TIM barrel protein [Pseudorhodobacter sp.]|nr:TIM barrel protein [Pseudorhodobacter sp.]